MSDITQNIEITTIDLGVTVNTNQLSFTPSSLGLNLYAGGIGIPGGAPGTVQFNAGGILNGTSDLTYSGGVTTVTNINVTTSANLGTVSNVYIAGGSANYALITDGAGNLSWGQIANVENANFANYANFAGTAVDANYAAYAGNVTIAGQPNITSLGTLTGFKTTGLANFVGASNVALGAVGNVHLTGGTNGQYLQTDGTGNIAWVTGGGSGNGEVGGSDTQIQFNDGGVFAGNVGFTFNKTTGNAAIPNNLSVVGNVIAGNITSPVVLSYGIEQLNLITAQTGTYNFDIISNAIRYTTSNAAANLTVNYRGNSTVAINSLLANGQSVTGTYVFKTGATPYGITALQVDSSVQTIKWASNIVPAQIANTLTSYVFTIVKTSTTPTYDVLGSATRYG